MHVSWVNLLPYSLILFGFDVENGKKKMCILKNKIGTHTKLLRKSKKDLWNWSMIKSEIKIDMSFGWWIVEDDT